MRDALEVLEARGPMTYWHIWPTASRTLRINAAKYCDRAVSHGLAEVDTSVRPRIYRALPGWRERIDSKQRPHIPAKPVVIYRPVQPTTFGAHNPWGARDLKLAQQIRENT